MSVLTPSSLITVLVKNVGGIRGRHQVGATHLGSLLRARYYDEWAYDMQVVSGLSAYVNVTLVRPRKREWVDNFAALDVSALMAAFASAEEKCKVLTLQHLVWHLRRLDGAAEKDLIENTRPPEISKSTHSMVPPDAARVSGGLRQSFLGCDVGFFSLLLQTVKKVLPRALRFVTTRLRSEARARQALFVHLVDIVFHVCHIFTSARHGHYAIELAAWFDECRLRYDEFASLSISGVTLSVLQALTLMGVSKQGLSEGGRKRFGDTVHAALKDCGEGVSIFVHQARFLMQRLRVCATSGAISFPSAPMFLSRPLGREENTSGWAIFHIATVLIEAKLLDNKEGVAKVSRDVEAATVMCFLGAFIRRNEAVFVKNRPQQLCAAITIFLKNLVNGMYAAFLHDPQSHLAVFPGMRNAAYDETRYLTSLLLQHGGGGLYAEPLITKALEHFSSKVFWDGNHSDPYSLPSSYELIRRAAEFPERNPLSFDAWCNAAQSLLIMDASVLSHYFTTRNDLPNFFTTRGASVLITYSTLRHIKEEAKPEVRDAILQHLARHPEQHQNVFFRIMTAAEELLFLKNIPDNERSASTEMAGRLAGAGHSVRLLTMRLAPLGVPDVASLVEMPLEEKAEIDEDMLFTNPRPSSALVRSSEKGWDHVEVFPSMTPKDPWIFDCLYTAEKVDLMSRLHNDAPDASKLDWMIRQYSREGDKILKTPLATLGLIGRTPYKLLWDNPAPRWALDTHKPIK